MNRVRWAVMLWVLFSMPVEAASPWASGYAQEPQGGNEHRVDRERRVPNGRLNNRDSHQAQQRRRDMEQPEHRNLTMDQAVRNVQDQYGGRVLSAQPEANGYRIRVLDRKGVVRTVFVDASGGQR